MHVALDTSALDPSFRAHSIRGTGRYVSELYFRLSKILKNPDHLSTFQYSSVGRGGFLDHLVDYLPAGRTTVRHQLLYPLSLAKNEVAGADLLHFPVHADAPTWCKKPFVVTVLDLIPLIFKEMYAPKKNDKRFQLARWLELQSIKNAEAVFAISENTAKDVHELLSVPQDRIIVTPLGVDPSFFDRKPHGDLLRHRFGAQIDEPIILYVGGIDQRKNITLLLEVFAEVLQERRVSQQPLPLLVMVGGISGDDQYPSFKEQVNYFGIQPRVVETGYVSDEELRSFYREADVFFYPSLYEGFGLPPLEAMASGTAVVCSDTSSLPEVVGDTALQFSPKDVNDAAAKLLMVLQCRDLRKRLEQKGAERAEKFTWEKTARLTAEGYKQIYSRLGTDQKTTQAVVTDSPLQAIPDSHEKSVERSLGH